MKRPWRGWSRPGGGDPGEPGLPERFGLTCPVCGATLGAEPPLDARTGRFAVPPSFRLEVGPPDSMNRYAWRLNVVGGRYPRPQSTEPVFTEHEIDYVYLLCGGGHIFPDSAPILRVDDRQSINGWNMVAALGAPASGKTYLLLRMLYQSLDNPDDWTADGDGGRVRQYQLSPLEQVPLADRANQYAQTLATGAFIQPTLNHKGRPEGILSEQLPDALDAIKEMIRRTVVDGERRAAEWGKRFRQPLVVRTTSRGRRTWTGVADLPGELFDPGTLARERVKLRDYDALVWVIDPAVAAATLDRFAEDSLAADASYRDVLDGSLRPGTVREGNADVVRSNRDHIQAEIGRQLSMVEGVYTTEQRAALQVLVTVTKCDLIHAPLAKKALTDLGEPGEVARGTKGFLALLARQFEEGRVSVDGETAALLHYLRGGAAADQSVRQQRVGQVADELLSHYSAPGAFWNLVHTGGPDKVEIATHGDITLSNLTLRVPSIGAHLDRSLERNSARRTLFRDAVMSAIACGVAYGLGHEDALFKILREPGITARFFLCSPLGTVPSVSDDGDGRLRPLESKAHFPRVQDRSAALTQLLLSALGKARA